MKVHTKDSVQELIRRSDRALYAGVRAIHARQTADEQVGHLTRHTNKVGWSKFDAPWMTDMIVKLDRYGSLLDRPKAITRNKLLRYHRQLVEIANENEARKALFQPLEQPACEPQPEHSVSGDYNRLQARCGCEDNDGELLLEECPTCLAAWRAAHTPRVAEAGYGDF